MTSSKAKTSKDSAADRIPYAIVETSGSQFWFEANRYYDLDRISANVEDTITIDKVLLINDEKGLSIGNPYVKGATVELKVLAHKRGPKIIVYKMRPKKKTRTKNGHRQELTRVMVTSISNGSTKKTKVSSTTTTSKLKAEKSNSGTKTSTVEKASD